MEGHAPQAPTPSTTARSLPVVNPALDYINGHGSLPDAPSSSAPIAAPAVSTARKVKSKKAADPNETRNLLNAKINQLELDAAGEKDQEAEIGGYSSTNATREKVLACMKKHDLPADMIAEIARAFDEGGVVSMIEKGLPSLGSMESLLANFKSSPPEADLARTYESLFNTSLMDQQKLTSLPPGLYANLEREVKKATRDLTNLLTGMDTPMSKLETVQRKYTELLAEMKRVDRENTKNKKRADLFQKEKDQGRSELTKTQGVRAKLENICRELQRDNKKLKDEQRRIEDSEKASREDLSDRSDALFLELEDAVCQMDNPGSGKQDLELDTMFQDKFKAFLSQYELRETHFHALMRTKESEAQLNLLKAEEQRKRAETETTKSRTLSAQVSTFSQTETELRGQLNIYVEKFKQVEDTLNNSNDLFLTFRKEMEEMSKKTKRLEKDNLNLTRKHDLTNRNILEMAEERTKVNKEMETLRKKNTTFENVIRQMQAQGRTPAGAGALEGDEEGTESDYEEEDYDDEGSEEGEYDDDTEEEALQEQIAANPVPFGPVPPPPPATQGQANGKVNGEINGAKSIHV